MSDPQSMPFGADAIVFAPSRILDPESYPSGGVGMVGTANDYLVFLEMLRTGALAKLPAAGFERVLFRRCEQVCKIVDVRGRLQRFEKVICGYRNGLAM